MQSRALLVLAASSLFLTLAHCGSDGETGVDPQDAGEAGAPRDGSLPDSAADAGHTDASAIDSSVLDASLSDAGAGADSSVADANVNDASVDSSVDAMPAIDGSGGDASPGDGGVGACTGGTLRWAHAIASQFGLGSSINAGSVAVRVDGSLVIAGSIAGTAMFGEGTAHQETLKGGQLGDAFVAHFDADGAYLWGHVYSAKNGAYAGTVRALPDGSSLVIGQFEGNLFLDYGKPTQKNFTATGGDNDFDIFLAKLDPNGNLVWAKSAGGTDFDFPWAVDVRADGSSIVTGRFGTAFAHSITLNPGESTAITLTRPSANWEDNFIASYDANGTATWARAFGGTSRDDDVSGVTLLGDGSIAVTGVFVNDTSFEGAAAPLALASPSVQSLYIAHYTSSGAIDWARAPTGSTRGYHVREGGGAILLTGEGEGATGFGAGESTATSLGSGGNFVARYASNGGFLGVQRLGASLAEGDMIALPSGDVMMVGSFYMSGTFASAGGDQTMTSLGWEDAFIACAHPASGTVGWVRRTGGNQHDSAHSVARMPNGDVIVLGSFTADAAVNAGLSDQVAMTVGNGFGNVFLAKYAP